MAVLHEGRVHALGEPTEVLSPDTLREVFGVDAVRLTDPATGRVHLSIGPGALPAATARKALA